MGNKAKVYTMDEVRKHDSPTSCWLALHGKVYDMTEYVPRHPGGHMILMGAGRDASALFESHHPLKVTTNQQLLAKFYIGDIEGYDASVEYNTRSAYYTALKKRVEAYFKENGMGPRDSTFMYCKAFAYTCFFFLAYYGTYYAFPQSFALSAMSALLFGFAIASMGMNVMHDGNHGGFSDRPWVNRLAGTAMDLIGGSSFVWRQIHQIGHHVHTNVEDSDPDIHVNDPHFRRIKRSQPWYAHYAFQHLYLMVLYAMLTFELFFRDFPAIFKMDYNGVRFQPISAGELALFWTAKIGYLMLNVVLPLNYSAHTFQNIILLACISLATSSYVLVTMFQVNHVVESASFYRKDPKSQHEGLGVDWAAMQTEGSADFSSGSFMWNFISGGLNHQIEHHLFPAVCHVHYPALSKIVRQTAQEHGLRYNAYPGFFSAVRGHWELLMQMGVKHPKFD